MQEQSKDDKQDVPAQAPAMTQVCVATQQQTHTTAQLSLTATHSALHTQIHQSLPETAAAATMILCCVVVHSHDCLAVAGGVVVSLMSVMVVPVTRPVYHHLTVIGCAPDVQNG